MDPTEARYEIPEGTRWGSGGIGMALTLVSPFLIWVWFEALAEGESAVGMVILTAMVAPFCSAAFSLLWYGMVGYRRRTVLVTRDALLLSGDRPYTSVPWTSIRRLRVGSSKIVLLDQGGSVAGKLSLRLEGSDRLLLTLLARCPDVNRPQLRSDGGYHVRVGSRFALHLAGMLLMLALSVVCGMGHLEDGEISDGIIMAVAFPLLIILMFLKTPLRLRADRQQVAVRTALATRRADVDEIRRIELSTRDLSGVGIDVRIVTDRSKIAAVPDGYDPIMVYRALTGIYGNAAGARDIG